jgi:hypothetical protein
VQLAEYVQGGVFVRSPAAFIPLYTMLTPPRLAGQAGANAVAYVAESLLG